MSLDVHEEKLFSEYRLISRNPDLQDNCHHTIGKLLLQLNYSHFLRYFVILNSAGTLLSSL